MHVRANVSKPALKSDPVRLSRQVLTNGPDKSNLMFQLDLEVKSGSVTRPRPSVVATTDQLTSLSPQALCHRSQGGKVWRLAHHDRHPGFLAQSIDVCRVVTRNRVAEPRASH